MGSVAGYSVKIIYLNMAKTSLVTTAGWSSHSTWWIQGVSQNKGKLVLLTRCALLVAKRMGVHYLEFWLLRILSCSIITHKVKGILKLSVSNVITLRKDVNGKELLAH